MDGSGGDLPSEPFAGSTVVGHDAAGSLCAVPEAGEGKISATVMSRKQENKSG